jgi:integrase
MKKTLPHLHRKKAKGKTYFYFDLGKDDTGRRVLKRLPDIRTHGFTAAYQAACSMRTRREGSIATKNFDWLCRIYEKSPEFRKLAENTKRLYSRHLGYANENFRNKAGRSAPLAFLTAEQMVALRDKYAATPGKANAILRSVGAIYAWAGKPGRRYVKENIASGIDPLEMGEHEAWPLGLIEMALEDPAMRLPVGLLYFTGQRISDVVAMGRGNLSQGVLAVTQKKTKTSLRITLHERLAAIIEQDVPKDRLLFLVNEWGKPLTESGLRQRIQAWAKGKGYQIVPHGLRKNAVNALLVAGCSVAEVEAITGQSLQMIEHYAKERDREELGRTAILKFEAKNKRGTRKQGLKTS